MLFSEKIELKLARRTLRMVLVSYFYTFYYNRDISIKKNGIKLFLYDTVKNFLILYIYINDIVNEHFANIIHDCEINKCLQKYNVTYYSDDIIRTYILKNHIIVNEDVVCNVEERKKILLSCIEDDTLMSLLCFENYFYLQKDLIHQMILLCDNEKLFSKVLTNDKIVYQQEKIEDFYTIIFDSLDINFNKIIDFLDVFITHWKKERIKLMEKIILCAAIIEQKLIHTPHSVVLNEYIDIAKIFCTTKSGKFINGILDIKNIENISLS